MEFFLQNKTKKFWKSLQNLQKLTFQNVWQKMWNYKKDFRQRRKCDKTLKFLVL